MSSSSATRRSSSSNQLPSRKRTVFARDESVDLSTCSFCGEVPASVAVQMPVLLRKKRAATPYCLACYYTSAAVRQEPTKFVTVCNQEQLDEQLTPMQQLFSEAYVDLRKRLQEEADRSFSNQKSDPLAMLHSGIGMAPKRMTRATKTKTANKEGKEFDGGFLRNIPIPERLLRTQQDQAKLQTAQVFRMNQLVEGKDVEEKQRSLSAVLSPQRNVYQRRKSSKRSIWNMAMDPATEAVDAQDGEEAARRMEGAPACSCGSRNVRALGSITSRNQDLKKGETWGMKDRGEEVVSRYQCNDCGKTWNVEA